MLFYVSINPWGVYVKEGEFFESQGGLEEEWGETWIPVCGQDVEDARLEGKKIRAVGPPVPKPAVNKEDYSKMNQTRLRSELGSLCGLHGQTFERECNACASALDARMSAKIELGRGG